MIIELGFYGKFSLNDKWCLRKVSPKIIAVIYRLDIPKGIFYFYVRDNGDHGYKQNDA
jgi:hypothetical protein